ncbi:hypothetical protein QOZ80_5AG0371600 [Eleusine coracana subsp. coracana]|nr:hypothetical protein QOZ80_5AG0371600 [Eleusine coracana subsp. coracana]
MVGRGTPASRPGAGHGRRIDADAEEGSVCVGAGAGRGCGKGEVGGVGCGRGQGRRTALATDTAAALGKKRFKSLDLKSFFSRTSSTGGSGSDPSTHESVYGAANEEGEGEAQRATAAQRPQTEEATETQVAIANFVEATQAEVVAFKDAQSQDSELIKVFLPDVHLISDPGLRIPIERFNPNIRGLAFRGHDESSSSLNKGNFLELLEWFKQRSPEAKAAFEELCPQNTQMISHKIQKDLTRCCAIEVSNVIKEEIDNKLFTVLIDESRDISIAEQMAVIVRFVNDKGMVIERFLGLKHVENTTSIALKKALLNMLSAYGLPIARLCGQGYDGASNMRGEFNGLQKQICDENPYAFYVHCFAHQLQLVIVSVTSSCSSFDDFFNYVGLIVTSASSSCRRKDTLVANHCSTILNRLESGEIFSGKGKHQSTNLVRPGDTRWGSHFTTLLRIESMWESVVKVLSMIHEDERNPGRAGGLVGKMESFSFVFNMKLMLKVLRITNKLSLLLQRKDQNIVQAMPLLVDVKARLVTLRNEGWEPIFEEVKSFCVAKQIPVPNMDEPILRWGRSRLQGNLITKEHHYRVDTFFVALDAIITELDHCFNEVSFELLVCISCLDPRDSFSKFDIDKIARLMEIYDQDFSIVDRSMIKDQLETFILHSEELMILLLVMILEVLQSRWLKPKNILHFLWFIGSLS